jgi:hypothetical protein
MPNLAPEGVNLLNLHHLEPIYSNKFGNFFEITPEKNPQLKDLDILVNHVEIREVEQKLS